LRKNIKTFFLTLTFILLTGLLLAFPKESLAFSLTGLQLWFNRMVPTLLPFMILSGIMIRLNLTEHVVKAVSPFLMPVFKISLNGLYAIVIGFLCGFPMGAKVIADLYEGHKISRKEASFLLAFCNNIGPIYFLSYVVPALAIDRPLIPFLLMYGIPVFYGFLLLRIAPLLRHTGRAFLPASSSASVCPAGQKEKVSLLAAIDSSVLSGLLGIAKLGGYMIFFNLLNILFVPFHHVRPELLNIYRCLLEITSGIDYSGRSMYFAVLILLPFGGFSCIAQTYSMIRQTDLSVRSYIFHKTMQTALTALCYLFLYLP